MPNRWALCMLAQTQSMVREGKWRRREKERYRVGGKEGEKEAALGFASGRAHSSNIDSVLLFFLLFFFFFFFFFSSVRSPFTISLSVSLMQILENCTNSTHHFAKIFFFLNKILFFYILQKTGRLVLTVSPFLQQYL